MMDGVKQCKRFRQGYSIFLKLHSNPQKQGGSRALHHVELRLQRPAKLSMIDVLQPIYHIEPEH